MRGFDGKFIEELKDKNDIVDVIGRYVRLEQRGGTFWGNCPFHHEKTPSFAVNSQGQFFHCFGCNKSGDVITFISEIESLDFSDSVKFLADRAKIPLPEIGENDERVKEQKKRRERLLALLKDAARFYARNLKTQQATPHVDYIYKRKISSEYVAKFGIGASLDYDGLPKHLRSLGYTDEEMTASGAVGEKNGKYYDALAGRLIIPVIDRFGNVIAFCGRIIDNRQNVGKYVNTRETAVFSKGKNLFNINNLKKLKNEVGLDGVIIVEGHMDVISLYQAGIKNVVASMGTALTNDQARMLKRYTDKVYICYDGDSAGKKATVRGLDILRDQGIEVKVVSLPNDMDPDEVVTKYGAEAYKKCVDEALPLIDFKLELLKSEYDVKTVDGKRKYVSAAVKVIRESPSPAEQEDLLKTVRDVTGTTFEALKRELYSVDQEAQSVAVPTPTETVESGEDKLAIAERFVIYAKLFAKEYAQTADLADMKFGSGARSVIKEYLMEREIKKEKPNFSDLFDIFGEDCGEELSKIASLETDESKRFDQAAYFNDCVKVIKIARFDEEISSLSKKSREVTDNEERRAIVAQMSALIAQRNKLK